VHDVVAVRALDDLHLWLRFADGTEGTVDLAGKVRFVGLLRKLREPEYFRQVSVNRESGTVEWPGAIDLDPDQLYAWARGQVVDNVEVPAIVPHR
jgi:hypothetical protein